MSPKVYLVVINKAGEIIEYISRTSTSNNRVKYNSKMYKLLKAPSLIKTKYIIIIDGVKSSKKIAKPKSVFNINLKKHDTDKEYYEMNLKEYAISKKYIEIDEDGFVNHLSEEMEFFDIELEHIKIIYNAQKRGKIIPESISKEYSVQLNRMKDVEYKPEPNIGISPYKDLVPIMEGVYKGKNVLKSTQKDAEKLFDAIYGNDLNTVIKIGNKYENEYLKSKKRGTTRDKFILVDSSKVRIFNLSILAESKMK